MTTPTASSSMTSRRRGFSTTCRWASRISRIFLRGRRGRLADLEHPLQEELDPPLPVASEPDRHQPVVILGPVGLQVIAQVEQRALEDLPLAEQEGDQEPSHAAVAVDERVDGLELGVGQGAIDARTWPGTSWGSAGPT